MAMKIIADKATQNMQVNAKFLSLATILAKEENINLLLRMAVNKGDSILNTKVNANQNP